MPRALRKISSLCFLFVAFCVVVRQRLPIPSQLQGIVWHFNDPDEPLRPVHTHAELELNLCVRGRATCLIGAQHHEMKRHRALWLFPKDEHALIAWSADFEMWVAVFRPGLVQQAASALGEKTLRQSISSVSPLRTLADGRASFLAALAQDLHRRSEDHETCNSGLSFLLMSAWRAWSEADRLPATREVHPAVERAVFAIARGESDRNADDFAAQCGLSRARLSRLFKLQIGVSLADYRNRQRIERFYDLYRQGQRSTVLQAALDAGFGSAAQFYRVYHAVTGQSPSSLKR